MRKVMVKVVPRRGTTQNPLKQSLNQNQRDLLSQQLAPSQGESPQFSVIGAWDGATTYVNAQTGSPFKAVLNGETCMGRWLWRVHPFPRAKEHPKTNSNFQGHGGGGLE